MGAVPFEKINSEVRTTVLFLWTLFGLKYFQKIVIQRNKL